MYCTPVLLFLLYLAVMGDCGLQEGDDSKDGAKALEASSGAQCPMQSLVGQGNLSGKVHKSLI